MVGWCHHEPDVVLPLAVQLPGSSTEGFDADALNVMMSLPFLGSVVGCLLGRGANTGVLALPCNQALPFDIY